MDIKFLVTCLITCEECEGISCTVCPAGKSDVSTCNTGEYNELEN